MLDKIMGLVNQRVHKVLTVAEAAIPPSQYQAFRKIMLDEFGKEGLLPELERLLNDEKERDGKGRKEIVQRRGAL